MNVNKPRVIKDFEKLDESIREQIKLVYPEGFVGNLISYVNKDGQKVSALPLETDDFYYLVRMTTKQAAQIIDEDDDFDDDGILKSEVKEDYENKYSDLDYLSDNNDEDSEDEDDDFD